jgi:hypothetical protein
MVNAESDISMAEKCRQATAPGQQNESGQATAGSIANQKGKRKSRH